MVKIAIGLQAGVLVRAKFFSLLEAKASIIVDRMRIRLYGLIFGPDFFIRDALAIGVLSQA